MKLIQNIEDLSLAIQKHKSQGKRIGFVPTMGALHQGHLSLVEQAAQQADCVVVSIFVNPTQFNNKSDLANYPRTIEQDLEMLGQKPCDIVFHPNVSTMYPEDEIEYLDIDLGVLDNVMEGEHRPGHFAGVALVVHRLFNMVKPDIAFLGEKDFQQLAVIRSMVRQTNDPVQIVGCPTVREADGLAMSSRNVRLTPQHRAAAPQIRKALLGILRDKNTTTVAQAQQNALAALQAEPLFRVEYLEIVDKTTLLSAQSWDQPNGLVACVALWAGDVRLIDNILL